MVNHKIEMGPGRLFFVMPGGEEILVGNPTELTMLEAEPWPCAEPGPVRIAAEAELTATIKLDKDQRTKFFDIVLGLAAAIYDLCPDKKVVHLAQRHHKNRVRKKNRARAIRILEKMGGAKA